MPAKPISAAFAELRRAKDFGNRISERIRMPAKPKPKKRHVKQHDVRGASFLRVGAALRVRAENNFNSVGQAILVVAEELEAEGRRSRAMR
jgi:hypothetical protein